MKLKNLAVVWLAIGLLGVACGREKNAPRIEATAPGEKLHWLTDFEAAKAQAHTQSKTLLINFTGSDWCPPCMALEKEVFAQPEFAEYAAKNLVLMEVDFPHHKKQSPEMVEANEKLASRYGVEGFPTVGVLDANGKPLGALGYRPDTTAQSFIAELEKIRGAAGTSRP